LVLKLAEAQQSEKIGKTPGEPAAHLQILRKQDGNKCCPNLNTYSVGAGAHEDVDIEALLEGLEKDSICQRDL
jgi:hypothetical protein